MHYFTDRSIIFLIACPAMAYSSSGMWWSMCLSGQHLRRKSHRNLQTCRPWRSPSAPRHWRRNPQAARPVLLLPPLFSRIRAPLWLLCRHQGHAFGNEYALTGDTCITSGSIAGNLSTHILTPAGHFRA
jgi:hypothetical protein